MSFSLAKIRSGLALTLGVALAAVGLTACAQSGQPDPSTTPSTSAPGQPSPPWRGPLNLPDAYDIAMTIDDTAIVTGDQTLTGVNLDDLSIAWTVHTSWTLPLLGDTTGLAVTTKDNITVYDPHTGDVIGQAPLTPRPPQPSDSAPPTPNSTTITVGPGGQVGGGDVPSATYTEPTAPQTPPVVWETLYWAGNGLILVGNGADGSICARKMTDPGTCLWTAPNLWMPAADFVGTASYVIAGRWVNTGQGVVDITTGKPADFGADAGAAADGPVYYYGKTPDRVFRMTSPDELQRTGAGAAQPWDTTTDQPLSAAVPANTVNADPASSVFVSTINQGDDANTVTAYSWASGQQLWTQDNLFTWNTAVGLTGNIYAGTAYSPTSFEQDLVLLDATTGQEVARYPVPVGNPFPGSAVGEGKVYVGADSVFAHDNQTGAKQTLAVMPEQPAQSWDFVATPKHLALLSGSQNLWVLDL